MVVLNKFSLGRVALPLATLTAITFAIFIYIIRGRFSLFLHGCVFVYIVFGSIRTYVAYKKEGGFLQLFKDLIFIVFAMIILFILSIGLGWLIN